MPVVWIENVNGVLVQHQLDLGDLVLTYSGDLAQVREIDLKRLEGCLHVKLNTGDWVEPYQLVPVNWLGWRAHQIMKERGRSSL